MAAGRTHAMLFRRLAQTSSGITLVAVEGYVVSVVAHVVILGSLFASHVERPARNDVPDSFEWARFLLPPDRTPGTPAVREHVTYFAAPAPGGEGTLLTDTKEPERLQLDLPAGTKRDDLADTAASPAPTPESPGGEVMTVLEVDTAAVRVEDSAAPPYPQSLLEKRIEGTVAVQYVVDTTGRADTSSFVVLATTHPEFARAVKATLPLMRFNPAIMNSQKVRQLVQQQFSFRIDTTLLARQEKEKEEKKKKP